METLLKKKLSGAPVVDDDKRVVGILSEKDCLKIVMGRRSNASPKAKYATT